MNGRICIVIVFALLSAACSSSASLTSQQSNVPANGEIRFKAPDGWVTEKPSSNMRVAQYKLPKAEDDKEDASLVLYYFGTTQGGTAQANIDRWIGQFDEQGQKSAKRTNKIVKG